MIIITNSQLIVGSPLSDIHVEISLDTALYPNHKSTIQSILELEMEDKRKLVNNILRLKKLVWDLYQVIKEKLVQIPNRDPDYEIVEEQYKNMEKASNILIVFFERAQSSDDIEVLHNEIVNPIGGFITSN